MRAARALLWPVSFIKYDTRGPLYTLKIDLSRKNSLDFYAVIHLTLPDKSCEKIINISNAADGLIFAVSVWGMHGRKNLAG
jgi:hypothetical protein